MTHNMADLRREVAQRLRETLHGREIDTDEQSVPELPHMLGIVPVGAISTRAVESNTILDPQFEFWDEYYKDVVTRSAVESEVQTAIRSLKKDNILRITHPYGEEADIMYVEVDDVDRANRFTVQCNDCANEVEVSFDIQETDLLLDASCPSCGNDRTLAAHLTEL